MRRRITGLVIAMLMVAVAVVPVLAQPPVLPCTWYGRVTFDGNPVANGTVIRAKVGTTVVGTNTTSGADYAMLVPQEGGVPAEGATVNFYVVIDSTEYLGGSDTWNSGALKELNLAAVRCEDNPAVAVGLGSIYGRLVAAYGFRAGEGVGGWTLFRPAWATSHPEWNTLSRLYQGRGYWVLVNADCQLTYGSWNTPGNPLASYNLNNGWNLIGWMGC